MTDPVRTRIAPSPTGDPHVGTAYIALFSRALARRHGGQFIIRIEDTDRARSRPESETAILDSLRWLGLTWDEGPDVGGPHGPYRQSERSELYAEHARILVEKGKAYPCFCTPERLAELRKSQESGGGRWGYDRHCRSIDPAEAARRVADGETHVVRLAIPESGQTEFFDAIRGESIQHENAEIDDQVLLKSDGFPTYHLANVVDDHQMKITHVIRAEEWIPSTPKHVLLYDAFGWEKPVFAHLPLLRNADKSKISKRKNPVSLDWFRSAGYIPPALLNFLALLGGGPAGEEEVFDAGSIEEWFELEKVRTTAPVFDMQKLEWLNGTYLRDLDPEAYDDFLVDRTRAASRYLRPIYEEVRKRTKRMTDFDRVTALFFQTTLDYDPAELLTDGLDRDRTVQLLGRVRKKFKKLRETDAAAMENAARELAAKEEIAVENLFMLLRVAITGERVSLPLFETMEMMGRDQAVIRIDQAVQKAKQRR